MSDDSETAVDLQLNDIALESTDNCSIMNDNNTEEIDTTAVSNVSSNEVDNNTNDSSNINASSASDEVSMQIEGVEDVAISENNETSNDVNVESLVDSSITVDSNSQPTVISNNIDTNVSTSASASASAAAPEVTVSATTTTTTSTIVPRRFSTGKPNEEYYNMIFRCYGTTVTNTQFKGVGVSSMFSFGAPKNEKRLLRVARSQFYKPTERMVGSGYEVIYESEQFDDGKPDFFPHLMANLVVMKDLDCKLQISVIYSSSKTAGTEVFLCGTTVSFRETVKAMKTGVFRTPMISEFCVGASIELQFVAPFPRLLTIGSLGINFDAGYMNPIVQKYVFYNNNMLSCPIVDVAEIVMEPRLSLRASNMFIQSAVNAIEKSMDAWKKRFHLERMRQGFYRDPNEAFAHGWHMVQITIVGSRMKLKKEALPQQKLPENHIRKTVNFMTTLPVSMDAYGSQTKANAAGPSPPAAPNRLTSFRGMSIRHNPTLDTKEKPKTRQDDLYPSSFVNCRFVDPLQAFKIPVGRTNTEYYSSDTFYGSNINAGMAKKARRSHECAPNIYPAVSPKNYSYGVIHSAMYDENGISNIYTNDINVTDITVAKGEEFTFSLYVPRLENCSVEFDLVLEEYLGKPYENLILGSVSLDLNALKSTNTYNQSTWYDVRLTNPEANALFDSAEMLLKVGVASNPTEVNHLKQLDLQFYFKIDGQPACNIYDFHPECLPSSSFLVESENSRVYVYDRSEKVIKYNNNFRSEETASTTGFATVVDEKTVIADCYEWLYAIGYSGADPLIVQKSSPQVQARGRAHSTYVSYCLEESAKLEIECEMNKKIENLPESDHRLFNRIVAPYSLTKIMNYIGTLKEILNKILELQIEVTEMMQRGMSFRPSGMKKNSQVQSLPVNFHYQMNVIREHAVQNPNELISKPITINSSVTCGCFCPHGLGYKKGIYLLEGEILQQKRLVEEVKFIYNQKIMAHNNSSPNPSALSCENPMLGIRRDLMEKVELFDALCVNIGLRRLLSVSQALSVLINTVHMRLCMVVEGYIRPNVALKWLEHGFLVLFQGLLSVSGNEKTMLEDTISAVEALNLYQIKLYVSDSVTYDSVAESDYDVLSSQNLDHYTSMMHSKLESKNRDPENMNSSRGNITDMERGKTQIFINGREISMYLPKDATERLPEEFRVQMQSTKGLALNIKSILFSQGIDIQQSFASTFSSDVISGAMTFQSDINMSSFYKLNNYVRSYYNEDIAGTTQTVHKLCHNLRESLERTSASAKNVNLLAELERINNVLGGCLVTFCKSGKDRTGMVVTFRESRLLCENYGCGTPDAIEASAVRISNVFREYGCRVRVCEKNTGKRVYSFNKLQCQFLPSIYRPPQNVTEDLIKSGDTS